MVEMVNADQYLKEPLTYKSLEHPESLFAALGTATEVTELEEKMLSQVMDSKTIVTTLRRSIKDPC